MAPFRMDGYMGQILRVDLSGGRISVEELDPGILQRWVGGVGLGSMYLYSEVPPEVQWSDPENRLIWTTGPLAGTGLSGAATFNVAAKGPMTNLAGSSQANGYLGAYLKFSGFDGIIFQGTSPHLVYLWVKGGKAEIRDARHLAGRDMWETEDLLRKELGVKEKDVSIFGIGPAGENRVFYSAIVGDRGHVAAHNGVGAVMGSKKLKAVVVYKGRRNFNIHDPEKLGDKNKEIFERIKASGFAPIYQWGSGVAFSVLHGIGALPVKNLTTNIYPEHEKMNAQYLRSHYKIRTRPCYACRFAHVKEVTVTEGPYKGFVGEEPEYEQIAAWGPIIGNTDLGAVVMLTREVDKLGMDCNEASWCIGWAMECFQKGIFTMQETDGLDLSWGNVEVVKELLNRIARRQGNLGGLLANGVLRASQKIGGIAADWAVYAQKGATPRGHDHRGRWHELFDTCVTNTSTLESTWGGVHPDLVDLPPVSNPFSHEEVSTVNARFNGIRLFDDCLGSCRFAIPFPKLALDCLNSVTGWNWTLGDVFVLGRRIVNLLRIFNFRHGMKAEHEKPSKRYGSVPVDGPAQGKDIMSQWPSMLSNYYNLMGWDTATGKPLPETLRKLGMTDFIEDL